MQKNYVVDALDKQGLIVAQGPLSAFASLQKKRSPLRFNITPQNKAYVHFVLQRCNAFARSEGLPLISEYAATVDLFAAHSNDAPINFKAMFECGDVGALMQFVADVGLRLNRSTGLLAGGWRGRFHVQTP